MTTTTTKTQQLDGYFLEEPGLKMAYFMLHDIIPTGANHLSEG